MADGLLALLISAAIISAAALAMKALGTRDAAGQHDLNEPAHARWCDVLHNGGECSCGANWGMR